METAEDRDLKLGLFEYERAQEMLRHYDSLNWQIGSILIASTLVLTGLIVKEDLFRMFKQQPAIGLIIVFLVPAFSLLVLWFWVKWFERHRFYYNLRNEALHRLEEKLGMYHFLRVAEADLPTNDPKMVDAQWRPRLETAKARAGYGKEGFRPLYLSAAIPTPSGFRLAKRLAAMIPGLQLLFLLLLWLIART